MESAEIWRRLEEYRVEVSDLGNVKKLDGSPCSISTSHGYKQIPAGKGAITIHRLVMLAFVGQPNAGYEVNHINNDRADNRLANLEYVTSSQNTIHAVKSGRWPIGERRWNSKLNDELVRDIRSLSNAGWSIGRIAETFGLNFTTTYHVIRRNSWKHVA